MKIVVTGTRGIPDIMGGVETHCEELFPRIAAMGHDVTVIRRSCYVAENNKIESYKGSYCKLFNAIGEVETAEIREHQFLDRKGYCTFKQDDYKIIPGDPIAFWISDNFLKTFRNRTRFFM